MVVVVVAVDEDARMAPRVDDGNANDATRDDAADMSKSRRRPRDRGVIVDDDGDDNDNDDDDDDDEGGG